MIRRFPALVMLAAVVSTLVVACGGSVPGPALTDPTAIVTAALTSTEAAKTVHLEVAIDGTATVGLPLGSGTGTPVDLTGTTASANIDFANEAAKATFDVEKFNLAGEVIAVGGKTYVKTTLTGPLYLEAPAGSIPVDPGSAGTLIDNLGDLLLKPGVVLVKGDDVACGSEQCYTVSTDLTASQLGLPADGIAGMPVDVAGATLKLTIRVEKDLPYHLAGVTAVASMPNATSLKLELTA
jgi:hypothetical protein